MVHVHTCMLTKSPLPASASLKRWWRIVTINLLVRAFFLKIGPVIGISWLLFWMYHKYTALSTFSSSARYIILGSFKHTESLSIDETNDQILASFFFRSVTVELPIPNLLAILVAFALVCSTCFLAIEFTCVSYMLRQPFILLSTSVFETQVVNYMNIT